MNLVEKIERMIRSERLMAPEDRIVVAVSGGPDSIALLHILFLLSERWQWKLVVAHVNHQFRGEESDREATFVVEYADQLGLPCEVGLIDVPAYIRESGLNSQLAAREKRYIYLQQVASDYECHLIALAHHADDQAETVLMRFLRGSGSTGLAGIRLRRPLKNVELIRPLLRIYKSEVLEHCLKHELRFCIDSSNAQRKYFRNQVRNDLIPLLQQFNPQLPEAMNRLAEVLGQEDDYMEQEVEAVFKKHVAFDHKGIQLSRLTFGLLHVALQRRLIKLILTYLASDQGTFDFVRLELIRTAIIQEQTSALTLHIRDNIYFIREYDILRFTSSDPPLFAFNFSIVEAESGELTLPDEWKLSYSTYSREGESRLDDQWTKNHVMFDLDLLHFPLSVRSRENGDRIQVIGLNGSKKVKDIFIDEKVPLRLRSKIPLVIDASGHILWIPGFRRSAHALSSEQTIRFFTMSFSV